MQLHTRGKGVGRGENDWRAVELIIYEDTLEKPESPYYGGSDNKKKHQCVEEGISVSISLDL